MTPHRDRDEPVLSIEDLSVTFFVRQSFFRTRPIRAVSRVDLVLAPVSYTHLTLPTTRQRCRSRGSPGE